MMKTMDRKKVLLMIVLVVAGIAAVGVSVSMFTGRKDKVETFDPRDSDHEALTGDEQAPSLPPSNAATILDSLQPTQLPSMEPSVFPSDNPTTFPSTMTDEPSHRPSNRETVASTFPSELPTKSPSLNPTLEVSVAPSTSNTTSSSGCRRSQESDSAVCRITIFYAIADVPYSNEETLALPGQILSLPDNAEFLIHLGDIRSARAENECNLVEFEDIAATLKLSKVPVFIVVGDNEWNDCSNIEESWGFWEQELGRFEDHWDHDFQVTRPANRPENFAFIHKKTLFIGLNLVAGRIHDELEWRDRLTEQYFWTAGLMSTHTGGNMSTEQVRSVVIFGHANPTSHHDNFFLPLKNFIQNQLASDIPVMYMNGDAHEWSFDPSYLGAEQSLRIQLTGGTSEPPLQVIIAPTDDAESSNAESVFLYDRRM